MHPLLALLRCRRGGVSTEYLMLVAVMGLTLAATLTAIAPGSVLGWSNARRVLYGRAP